MEKKTLLLPILFVLFLVSVSCLQTETREAMSGTRFLWRGEKLEITVRSNGTGKKDTLSFPVGTRHYFSQSELMNLIDGKSVLKREQRLTGLLVSLFPVAKIRNTAEIKTYFRENNNVRMDNPLPRLETGEPEFSPFTTMLEWLFLILLFFTFLKTPYKTDWKQQTIALIVLSVSGGLAVGFGVLVGGLLGAFAGIILGFTAVIFAMIFAKLATRPLEHPFSALWALFISVGIGVVYIGEISYYSQGRFEPEIFFLKKYLAIYFISCLVALGLRGVIFLFAREEKTPTRKLSYD